MYPAVFLVLVLLAQRPPAAAAAAAAAAADIALLGQSTATAGSSLQESPQTLINASQPSSQVLQAAGPTADLQQVLRQMLAVPITTPSSVLALGYKGVEVGSLRNWHLLARKLSTPGSTVTIAAFGGSLTAGYLRFQHAWQSSMEGSWVEQMVAWLQASVPSITFNTLNLSRGASEVTVAATCWYQYVPQVADLVLVEYSVNGCRNADKQAICSSAVMPRVASYENLYRRVIRKAPSAALMSVAMFGFTSFSAPARDNTNTQVQLPNPFSNSGEELHGMIARRYGAPMASLRDSLYDLMFNDEAAQQLLGATRSALMAGSDNVHPTAAGFKVFGNVVAFTVRQTLAAVLANGAADPAASATAVKYAGGGYLPLPVSPVAGQQDTNTWCREGSGFQAVASCVNVASCPGKQCSCKWSLSAWHQECPHKNCRIRGYFMKGDGQELQAIVSTSVITGSRSNTNGAELVRDSNAENFSSDAGFGNSAANGFERRYLAVTYLQGSAMPAESMAIARLKCVQGCRCQPVQLAFHPEANTGMAVTEVSAHPDCVVRIALQTNTTTGGDEFAVTGIAVVPFSKAAQVNPMDSLDMAAGRAEVQQLPMSWP